VVSFDALPRVATESSCEVIVNRVWLRQHIITTSTTVPRRPEGLAEMVVNSSNHYITTHRMSNENDREKYW